MSPRDEDPPVAVPHLQVRLDFSQDPAPRGADLDRGGKNSLLMSLYNLVFLMPSRRSTSSRVRSLCSRRFTFICITSGRRFEKCTSEPASLGLAVPNFSASAPSRPLNLGFGRESRCLFLTSQSVSPKWTVLKGWNRLDTALRRAYARTLSRQAANAVERPVHPCGLWSPDWTGPLSSRRNAKLGFNEPVAIEYPEVVARHLH